MTALTAYERLECPGLWRATPVDQRREVVVSLRSTSLVLTDPKTDMALSHWSLPALVRDGTIPGATVYKPGDEAIERLEVEDDTMIAALDRIILGLARRKPHPGRLRGALLGASLVALIAACTLWLPGVLTRQTAAILPEPNLAELGQMALADLETLTGSPCKGALGLKAASAFSERLLGKGGGRIMVVRDGLRGALALPGGLIVISRDLVEAPPDAETAAGFVLAALAARGEEHAQTEAFLDHAGLVATFRLLTSGTLPAGSMEGLGQKLLEQTAKAPAPPAEALLPLFQAAEVSPRAYAGALSGPDELAKTLIAADPFAGQSPRPVLADGNWISLQSICFDD